MGLSSHLFGLILIASIIYQNEAVIFKLTNAICTNVNTSLFVVNECRLRAVSRNKTTYNLSLNVLHPVNNALIRSQLYKKANGYKPWLYKSSLEACRFIRKPYNPVAIIIFRLFKDYSNFNHTCPYVGLVIVKDVYPRLELLPHTIPTGEYMLTMDWYIDKRLQITTSVNFEFVEDLL